MENFSHHATILPVSNIQGSLKFYTQKLGFTCTFKWDDPPTYAVLKRGGVSVHLALHEEVMIAKNVRAYTFCHNVEAVYKEFQEQGVSFHEPLSKMDYGMQEFSLKDLDGHILAFGQEVS